VLGKYRRRERVGKKTGRESREKDRERVGKKTGRE